jgi:uncharacterized protein
VARISLSLAVLCLLLCGTLQAQPVEPPEFRAAAEAISRGDYDTALPLLREQATEGYPPSGYLLALLYLVGDGVERNETAAAFWLHKAVLTDYPLAQYQLAVMLDEGLGIDPDEAVATTLLERAALNGNALAENRLRIMRTPVGSDKEELEAADGLAAANAKSGAFLHRLRIARRGNTGAQYAVGLAYLSGGGTARNPDKAVEWIRKAAVAGDVRAQSLLGTLLAHGDGAKHDLREAIEWYRKAAAQGDAEAEAAARALASKVKP